MKITRDLLLSTAKSSARNRAFLDKDLMAIYLTGSLLEGDGLLGGAADIDLVFIHALDAPVPREIVRLGDDFHLDIAHYPQALFATPRRLRTNAWVGSFLCNGPLLLHDTNHWFEFTQSGVFSQFFQPANVMERARPFSEKARQRWMELIAQPPEHWPDFMLPYLRAVMEIGNTLACLSGTPLSERRFLLDLPARCQKLGVPELAGEVAALFLPPGEDEPAWLDALNDWRSAMLQAATRSDCPPDLQACRLPYYEKAILGIKEESPAAALWIMLWSYTEAVALFAQRDPQVKPYRDFCALLGLEKSATGERLSALDALLDRLDEFCGAWSAANGLF